MLIAMLAIIGSIIKPGVAYWLLYAGYCIMEIIRFLVRLGKQG